MIRALYDTGLQLAINCMHDGSFALRSWIKTTAKVASLLAVGTVLGPVVIAALGAGIGAYRADTDELYPSDEAWLLLQEAEEYREYQERGNLILVNPMRPMEGKECGYEPKQLFPLDSERVPDALLEKRFTDNIGYHVLDRWRHETRDEEYNSARGSALDEAAGQFKLGFLRRCIAYTLVQGACHSWTLSLITEATVNISRYDHEREPLPYAGFGIEDEIVCTYVEGVARRRNLPPATES